MRILRVPLVFLVGISLILLSCVTSAYGDDGSGGERSWAKLKLEFYGGYSSLNPSDLNTNANYYEKYYDWYYGNQYLYCSSVYGDYFQSTGSKSGEFQKINRAFPLGVRIKYYVTSRLALSLGFQYVTKEETSSIKYQYDVRSTIPDDPQFIEDFIRTLEFSPLSITLKGYTPLLGIHYTIPLFQTFHLEGFVTGGILFARFKYSSKNIYGYSNIYEFWEESVSEYGYEGKGTGYTLGAGVRVEWHALRNFGLFIEGGYSLQKAGQIFGPYTYDYCYRDCNASEICDPTINYEGYWGLSSVYINREWGGFSGKRLQLFSDSTDSQVGDFHLDLSGFQIRFGLSIRIR